MREDRRRRYDDGFRREALELIKSGAGKDTLARRLAIPVYTARNWIGLYRSNGEEAVMGGGGSRRYDWETKVAASRDHVENGLTKTEAMARHGIASIAYLKRWCRDYRSGGAQAETQGQAERREIQTEARTDARAGARRTGRVPEGEGRVPEGEGRVPEGEGRVPGKTPGPAGVQVTRRERSAVVRLLAGRGHRLDHLLRIAGLPKSNVLPPPVAPGARVQAGRGADGTGDMGWQYQHQWWRDELERLGIRQSMSRKGNCLDNAAAEQVFGHLKDEFYRGRVFDSYEQFKRELDAYIIHWNTRRRQIRLEGRTPEEFRSMSLAV